MISRVSVWTWLPVVAILGFSSLAQAGPPLLCDPFEIGLAKSLPWGEGKEWHAPSAAYDIQQLVPDTLALLRPQTPVIVRMETLRRAAIYSSNDPRLAYELLSRLMARALATEAAQKPDPLSWFDAGYLVETFRQSGWALKRNLVGGLDGYAWTLRAIKLSGGNPEMDYAAALMKPDVPWPNEHLRKALASAKEGTLLARNLARYKAGR